MRIENDLANTALMQKLMELRKVQKQKNPLTKSKCLLYYAFLLLFYYFFVLKSHEFI